MAWTDPRTWTDTEVVTAAIMNAHVRDNLKEMSRRLGRTSLTAAGSQTRASSSGTFADVHAATYAVAFTVPDSGRVLVVLSAPVTGDAAGTVAFWNLRESSSDISGTDVKVHTGARYVRRHAEILVTGLTPGDAKTWKWGHATGGSGTVTLAYGFDDGTNGFGPAVMEVWSA